jgi:hypothetical protein
MEDFELEVFLSTDGKHTVRLLTKNEEQRNVGIPYAKALYTKILAEFGTKQGQAVKEYAKETGKDLGVCTKCGAPNLLSKNGKPYCSKKCWL